MMSLTRNVYPGSRCVSMVCGIEASYIPDMLVQYPGHCTRTRAMTRILDSHRDITITYIVGQPNEFALHARNSYIIILMYVLCSA